jgi:hypothetical protein
MVYDESTDDHASYTFAHRLRIRLWAEHLHMDDPAGRAALADGVASLRPPPCLTESRSEKETSSRAWTRWGSSATSLRAISR